MFVLVRGGGGGAGGGCGSGGVGTALKAVAGVWATQASIVHCQARSAVRWPVVRHMHSFKQRCNDGRSHTRAEISPSLAPLRRLLSSGAHDVSAPALATGKDRVRVLVMQPHFHNYRLRSRRHPLLQLDEAVALAAATPTLDPTAALLVPMRSMAEDMFFTRGKLTVMTELVLRHTAGPDDATHGAEALSGRAENDDAIAHPPGPPCRVDAVFLNTLALSPRQQLALETEWGIPVLDRFRVILDIFRARASTREAKLQVELAQIPYLRARLATSPRPLPGDTLFSASLLGADHDHRRGHGERQRGGQQAMSGAGETPLEKERRRLNSREKRIRAELDAIKLRRAEMHKRTHSTRVSDHTVDPATAETAVGPEADQAGEMLDALTQPGSRKRGNRKGKRKDKKQEAAAVVDDSHQSGRRESSRAKQPGSAHPDAHVSTADASNGVLATSSAPSKTHGAGGGSGSGAHRSGLPVVAVVGYTNAGKTALVRALSGSEDLKPQDMLFATLDTAARAGRLPGGLEAIFVDTVGFVSDLPHQLVEAFKSTLEEVAYADLVIHATDSTDPDRLDQKVCVLDVLSSELHLDPALLRNRIQVNTKIDLVRTAPRTPRNSTTSNAGGRERDQGTNGGKEHFSRAAGADAEAARGKVSTGTVADWKANMRGAGVVIMNEAHGYFGRQFKKLEVQLQHEGGVPDGDSPSTPSHGRELGAGVADGRGNEWTEEEEEGDDDEGEERRCEELQVNHAHAGPPEIRSAASELKRQQHADLIQDDAALDISVHTGENMNALREQVEHQLNAVLGRAAYTVAYPVSFGQGTQFVHNLGTVHSTHVVTDADGADHGHGATEEPHMKLRVTLDNAALNRLRAFFRQHNVHLGVQEQASTQHTA